MLRVLVMVSGGGTNLQAILDSVQSGEITDTEIVGVISNNPGAYALERGEKAGVPVECISPKSYASRAEFNQEFLKAIDSYRVPGSDSAGDDPEVQKPDHQYPSVTDSVVLRNRLLWAEGA